MLHCVICLLFESSYYFWYYCFFNLTLSCLLDDTTSNRQKPVIIYKEEPLWIYYICRIQQGAEPEAATRWSAEWKYYGEERTRYSKGRERCIQADRTCARETGIVWSQTECWQAYGLHQVWTVGLLLLG